jgi:hypothetical protein
MKLILRDYIPKYHDKTTGRPVESEAVKKLKENIDALEKAYDTFEDVARYAVGGMINIAAFALVKAKRQLSPDDFTSFVEDLRKGNFGVLDQLLVALLIKYAEELEEDELENDSCAATHAQARDPFRDIARHVVHGVIDVAAFALVDAKTNLSRKKLSPGYFTDFVDDALRCGYEVRDGKLILRNEKLIAHLIKHAEVLEKLARARRGASDAE